MVETGYAIVPDTISIFIISDYVRFLGGQINAEKVGSSIGYLFTIAGGVRFFVGPDLQMEILTRATPFGKNQFRSVGGHIGLKLALGM